MKPKTTPTHRKPPSLTHLSLSVRHALWLMSLSTLCLTALTSQNTAQAQTESELVWKDQSQATSKNQTPTTLPYCQDIQNKQTTNTPTHPSANRNDNAATYAVADQITGSTQSDLILKGQACIARDNTHIQADTLHYEYISENLTATSEEHNVIVQQNDGSTLRGKKAHYNLATGLGSVTPVQMDNPNTQGHLKAESLSLLSERRALLTQAQYTTCAADNPDWYLRADSFLLDQDSHQGTIRNASLSFWGIPILALPYAKLPIGKQRQSGFLTPSFGYSNQHGSHVDIPYYWNIAPNYDLTAEAGWLARRGARLSGEYRYLTRYGNGTWYGKLLPKDQVTQTRRDYWRIEHTHQMALGQGQLTARIYNQRASDDNFLDDFGGGDEYSGSRTIPSEYQLAYAAPDWSISLLKRTYQTLQNQSQTIEAPYDFEPQIAAQHRYRLGNWLLTNQAELTRFTHPNTTQYAQGMRGVYQTALAYQWRTPSGFFIPKIGLHYSRYHLKPLPATIAAQYDRQHTRQLPIFSLDSGVILARSHQWLGNKITQTLEPRLFYTYIPHRNQDRIWNFDSALADLDFARIYTENLFTGNDRIANANQLTTGVTSRILDQETGEEYLQLSVAQRYYFDQQRVGLAQYTANTNTVTRKSDLLGAASGRLLPKLWAQGFIQHNAQSGQLLRADASLRWQPAYRQVLNIGYHRNLILQEPSKTAYVSTQFPVNWLSNNLYAVARLNYNLNSSKLTEQYLGLEYAKDCWKMRFVTQRTLQTNGETTQGYFFQLELKGLGNLGNAASNTLKTQIDGYHPVDYNDE